MSLCCWKPIEFCEIWDTYYCPECHEWCESKCPDPHCDFCTDRPKKYDPEDCEFNKDWIGDGLQYKDPEGTFEGIADTDNMEIYIVKID